MPQAKTMFRCRFDCYLYRVASCQRTSEGLTDTLPGPELLDEIRCLAGVADVAKCYSRSTALQYHVDLHIEVDPELTERESHDIASETPFGIRRELEGCGRARMIVPHTVP